MEKSPVNKKDGDRRVRRTFQLLRDAFTVLLLERGYEAIKVQDIIDKADVARSTFYTHFLNKEDLLLGELGIFSSALNHSEQGNFTEDEDEEGKFILPTRALFRHVQAQSRIYKAMVGGPGWDLVIKTFHNHLDCGIQKRIKQYIKDEKALSVPLPVLTDSLTGALITLIKWWLDHDMPYPPERMDEIFQQLSMPGVYGVLGITL